ncbi:GGDEF domain-containing protein [Cohnella candidum]|uniref:GGDEF domain-containing protein n=1 Tax=Cohnella candidum TaxID=2674991 RepID=A0A3G3K3S9_9BACL|nr:GGDEF domain-containing protein [Cohnella candidum]AYQ75184.1 GGDEF domain-containing protein [Cohnella candidum]
MTEHLTRQESKWAGRVWFSYWCIIGVHFLAQLMSFLFLPYEASALEFYSIILIGPTLAMSAALFAAWIVRRLVPRLSIYSLLIAGSLISVTLVRLNTDIRIISALLLLPILASVIFYRIRLTLFASFLQFAAFILLCLRYPVYRNYLSDFDLVATPCFLAMCTWVAIVIMIRGRELREELYVTLKAKQELMAQYAAMRRQSQIDALTGLYNQASFHEHFELAWEYGRQHPESGFYLALIDIDNFKSVNDTYGHRAGDAILSRVSGLIRELVPENAIASRYGGEEFAILLLGARYEEAVGTMEAIRERAAGIRHEDLGGQAVTLSAGLAAYEPAIGKEELFERADARLYQAKRSGKNKLVTAT